MNSRVLVGAVTLAAISLTLVSSSISDTWASVIGSGTVQ